MNRILTLIIYSFTLTLFACKTKPPVTSFSCNLEGTEVVLSETCQPKMDCSFTIKNNGSIKMEYYNETLNSAMVASGDKMVFIMDRKYQDNPNIADDEFSEKLYFSIPDRKTSFHIEGEELAKAEMVFATLAYSRDGGYYPVFEGCMEGKLNNDGKWLVQGKITITTRTQRKIVKGIRAIYNIQ